MPKSDKVKMSQKEFNEVYEITEEIEVKTDEPIPDKQDTTQPEFLTEEESNLEDKYLEDYPIPPEEEDGK